MCPKIRTRPDQGSAEVGEARGAEPRLVAVKTEVKMRRRA
jgi:hypothetical protein